MKRILMAIVLVLAHKKAMLLGLIGTLLALNFLLLVQIMTQFMNIRVQ